MTLFGALTSRDNMASNGLNIVAMAVLASPILLRPQTKAHLTLDEVRIHGKCSYETHLYALMLVRMQ
jgi:hypothetical protein